MTISIKKWIEDFKNAKLRTKGKVGFWAFSLFLIGLFIGLIIYAETKLSRLVVGGLGESFSTKVYGSSFLIQDGSTHALKQLVTRLERLNYQYTTDSFLKPGEMNVDPPHISIYCRGFKTPTFAQHPLLVHLKQQNDKKWTLRDSEGIPVLEMALEPELVAELSGPKKVRRSPAHWDDFPGHLVQAVVAAEDHKFFEHWGIRPLAILRALIYNIRSKSGMQGGSTITQQLAKNLFLTPQRTLRRKVLEAFLSVYLELRYSKEKILTLYLNHIYMGQDGYVSVAGVKSASQFYFGKKMDELNIEESALLAGLIRSPYRYNPFQNPERAKKRRNFVLRRMEEAKFISADQEFQAVNVPVKLKTDSESKIDGNPYGFYVSEVVRRLSPLYGEDSLYRYGLNIYTEMDPLMQTQSHAAVQKSRHQAAVVVLNPVSGQVKAIVGGKNFKESQYNRATQAHRQPGSAFKPFVYGAALESGLAPSTFLKDELKTFKGREGEDWTPQNFDNVYSGTVTLRHALAASKNAATLDLAQKVGLSKVIDFARRMGIESDLEPSLALALGVYEVSLLEITAAYAPFVNGGFRVQPLIISSVLDAEGNIIEVDTLKRTSVIDPALSYLITSLLQSVVNEGTAQKLSQLKWLQPTAGKTGTTNGGKDAWFIGYTPWILAGIWVGDDSAQAIHAAGSKNALPIWAHLMKSMYADFPLQEFLKPEGLIKKKIDPLSGELAVSGCPKTLYEEFLIGTEPKNKCPLHKGGIKGWFQKWFKKAKN